MRPFKRCSLLYRRRRNAEWRKRPPYPKPVRRDESVEESRFNKQDLGEKVSG
jgi:hypothetical protein